jgi:hypothetical protein
LIIQQPKQKAIRSATNLDEIDNIHQLDEPSNDNIISMIEGSKCSSASSKQSSQMASPALSISSQSSLRGMTLLNHQVIQLPVDLEREILIKNGFDQLSKEN